MKLKPCPFCGGQATFYEFYESVDGRGDKLPKILCDCGVQLQLTYEEYHNIRVDFNYKGGYVSINKELLNAINQNVIDKWNRREPIDKVVEQLEEASYWTDPTYDEDGYSHDDEIEVIDLSDAIEIVKGGAE